MSNFDNNSRGPGYQNELRPGWPTSSWIALAAVVIILVLGIGYVFQGSWRGSSGMVEHRAAATDVPSPAATPLNSAPRAAPSAPAATPKP